MHSPDPQNSLIYGNIFIAAVTHRELVPFSAAIAAPSLRGSLQTEGRKTRQDIHDSRSQLVVSP